MQLVFLRLLLAAGLLLLICRLRGLQMPREPVVWMHFAVAATVGNVVPFFLFGVAERSVDSGLAGVLNATTPLWTVTVALLVRTERMMSVARAVGLLLGFAGTLVIFAPWRSGLSVSAATVLSAVVLPVGWQAPGLRADAVVSIAVLGLLGTGVAYILNYQILTATARPLPPPSPI